MVMLHNKSLLCNTEKQLRPFYQEFNTEYKLFLASVNGVLDATDCQTYTFVLLIRLVILYFLQKQGFLAQDLDYLSNLLTTHQSRQAPDTFYNQCLLPLFTYLSQTCSMQPPVTYISFERIPVLGLSLYAQHKIEKQYTAIQIPDRAFQHFFVFCEHYQWKLDFATTEQNTTLYPTILASLFESFINQKQTGSYYTQMDVTIYISTNTILPFLLQKINQQYPQEFATMPIWQQLQDAPERYLYDAIQCHNYLPGESEREYHQRQCYAQYIQTKLRTGAIRCIEDLTTYNLNVLQFVSDAIRFCQQPALLCAIYTALEHLTILDPTCGPGAFLSTALLLLTRLYTLCLERMQTLLTDYVATRQKQSNPLPAPYQQMHTILRYQADYPSLQQFVCTRIIEQTLYGIDLMDDATNLCMVNLYLALLSTIKRAEDIPPITTLSLHIRTGNVLISPKHSQKHSDPALRKNQQYSDVNQLEASLYKPLFARSNQTAPEQHKPFDWQQEFPAIKRRGGFDIIIGNPPYLEHTHIKQEYAIQGYEEKSCGNLYAAVLERALDIRHTQQSYLGLIVPISLCSGERFQTLRHKLRQETSTLWLANFDIFPGRLFTHAFQRLSILLAQTRPSSEKHHSDHTLYVTRTHRWYMVERPYLLDKIIYTKVSTQNKQSHHFPKFASSLHEQIIQKMFHQAATHTIASMVKTMKTTFFVYYQEATNYWIKAACLIPFYKKNDHIMIPPHGRCLFFADEQIARCIMAVMNSSLFYLWFAAYSDGFHLSHALVKNFPLHPAIPDSHELLLLSKALEQDIQQHTRYATRNTRTTHLQQSEHRIELEEYCMSASKPLLDEIDRVLALYYGFTDEEVQFILHYDLKHRLPQRKKDL